MSEFCEEKLGGRCWFRTSDPCRVKAFVSPARPSVTSTRPASGRRWLTAVYTAAFTTLAACGGGGEDGAEDDGRQRNPPIDCETRRDACI